jgi:hypothetical protein
VLRDGGEQVFAILKIMRWKRATVACIFAGLGKRQLIDAAPRHDLERGLHNLRLGFAPPLGMRTPAPGGLA